jgi:hypothetical protein
MQHRGAPFHRDSNSRYEALGAIDRLIPTRSQRSLVLSGLELLHERSTHVVLSGREAIFSLHGRLNRVIRYHRKHRVGDCLIHAHSSDTGARAGGDISH